MPPSLSLSLSPTSTVAPPLLPLCLELGALGESEAVREDAEEEVKDRRGEDDDDDEGSAPPSKLALLQVSMCSIYFFLKSVLQWGTISCSRSL